MVNFRDGVRTGPQYAKQNSSAGRIYTPGCSASRTALVSPDGKLLAYSFIQYRPNAWKLAVLAASGGQVMKIFDVPGGTDRVRWSQAGTSLQYLVTQDGATNLWEQPLAGGKPKQLTKFSSGRIFNFNWSSDHRKLLLTRGDVTSDVVLLSNLRGARQQHD
jgi:Tol biopolymer transport system component